MQHLLNIADIWLFFQYVLQKSQRNVIVWLNVFDELEDIGLIILNIVLFIISFILVFTFLEVAFFFDSFLLMLITTLSNHVAHFLFLNLMSRTCVRN